MEKDGCNTCCGVACIIRFFDLRFFSNSTTVLSALSPQFHYVYNGWPGASMQVVLFMSISLYSLKADVSDAYVACIDHSSSLMLQTDPKRFQLNLLGLGSLDPYPCTWYVWCWRNRQQCLTTGLCKFVSVSNVVTLVPRGLSQARASPLILYDR